MRWILAGALTVLVAGCGGSDAARTQAAKKARPTPTPTPPILPDKRVVAFYGNPAADGMPAASVATAVGDAVARLREGQDRCIAHAGAATASLRRPPTTTRPGRVP